MFTDYSAENTCPASSADELVALGIDAQKSHDFEQAIALYKQALAIYETLGDRAGMARATGNIGTALYAIGQNVQALEQYQRALALYTELQDVVGKGIVVGRIGSVHFSAGDFSQALEHYRVALDINAVLGDRSGVARVLGNIGNLYHATGENPLAFEHLRRALDIYTLLDDSSGVARVTGLIGNVYHAAGDYPKSIEHYQQSLDLHTASNDRPHMALMISNIGNVCTATHDFSQAFISFSRAVEMYTDMGDRAGVAIATTFLGSTYFAIANYEQALEHYLHALNLHTENGSHASANHVLCNIMHTHLQQQSIGDARANLDVLDASTCIQPHTVVSRESGRARLQELDGDLDAATATLTAALDVAALHNIRSEQAEVHKLLRDLAQQRNDFPAYIEHNNEFMRITEDLNGKQATLQLAMQAKERELAAKDKEVAKHMAVLHSTLPKHIADRVARGETVNDKHEYVAVVFLDLVGFTTMSSSMDAIDVVAMLERVFGICDATMNTHGLMKIKTIGDSYMAVAFDNIENAAHAALELANAITEVPVRIGIHCGPVVAGVLGKERMQYDVWGDTVNIASRMESTSEPGRIHISEAFANVLRTNTSTAGVATTESNVAYAVSHRGETEIKGKGPMNTYWLEGA